MVTVNLHPWLSEMAGGQKEAAVSGTTVGECLQHIDAMFPGIKGRLVNSEDKLRPYITILLNGENTYPEELMKPVEPGDTISFVFIIDGG
jgi:molybdopterin converting factor small subunit